MGTCVPAKTRRRKGVCKRREIIAKGSKIILSQETKSQVPDANGFSFARGSAISRIDRHRVIRDKPKLRDREILPANFRESSPMESGRKRCERSGFLKSRDRVLKSGLPVRVRIESCSRGFAEIRGQKLSQETHFQVTEKRRFIQCVFLRRAVRRTLGETSPPAASAAW